MSDTTSDTTVARRCPHCDAEVGEGDGFCEACGTDLSSGAPLDPAGAPVVSVVPASAASPSVTRPCAACGGEVGDDGWCTVCGARASNGRDHVVVRPSDRVAAVCDRGRHHPRNEDAVAVADDGRVVLVVCDGVTSATDSDAAALAAAETARDLLAATPADPAGPAGPAGPEVGPGERAAGWADRLIAAAHAADRAAAATAVAVGATHDPPSCTFAAVVVDGPVIVAAWVGDSRVYWFADDGSAEQLSTDHSWATEQVAAGMDRAAAEADPQAHSITRWLGADSGDPAASTATAVPTGPGWLLVCTDGLWNYCSAASDLADLVRTLGREATGAAGPAPDPGALAEALVRWANDQGGHDNVTVALARVEGARLA